MDDRWADQGREGLTTPGAHHLPARTSILWSPHAATSCAHSAAGRHQAATPTASAWRCSTRSGRRVPDTRSLAACSPDTGAPGGLSGPTPSTTTSPTSSPSTSATAVGTGSSRRSALAIGCPPGPTPSSRASSSTRPHSRSVSSGWTGMHLSVRTLLESLAGIEETLPLDQGERGRPRAQRMLTEVDATQRRLYDLFGLDAHAPKRRGGAPSEVLHTRTAETTHRANLAATRNSPVGSARSCGRTWPTPRPGPAV